MSDQFAQPGPPGGEPFDFNAHNGALLLIEVIGYEEHVPTVHTLPGEKTPAVRANINVLDGRMAGEKTRDTLVFPKVLQGQLRSNIGKLVLGRLRQGEAKNNKNPAWELTPATPQDTATAQQFMLAQRTVTPNPAEPPF